MATKLRVASLGARVPWPTRANRLTHQLKSANPSRITTVPMARESHRISVLPDQRESAASKVESSHQGTPTTTRKGKSRMESECRSTISIRSLHHYYCFRGAGTILKLNELKRQLRD